MALSRLTGVLGLVCQGCDAYNEPGATACAGCGEPLGASAPGPAPPPAQAAAAVRARLVLERGEGAPGTSVEAADGEVRAGRSEGQLAFPRDPCLAPLHATFSFRDGALFVRDEGAAGGLFLRLRGLTVPLRPGALFALGDRLLRLGVLPEPAAAGPDGTRRLGAARPDAPALVLEEWLEGGVAGRRWVRSGASVTVGRAGCSVDLGDDPHLSPAHAEILLDGAGRARLRDLGSATGTFLQVPPGAERELLDGDAVRLGREVLRVEMG